jgi:hypothetical protein
MKIPLRWPRIPERPSLPGWHERRPSATERSTGGSHHLIIAFRRKAFSAYAEVYERLFLPGIGVSIVR